MNKIVETIQSSANDLYNCASKMALDTYALVLIVPAVFFIFTKLGVRTWLKLNISLSIIYGALLIVYPDPLVSYSNISIHIDAYQRFLCALFGCYQICAALFPLCLFDSKDESIFISHFWSKIIACSFILIDNLVTYQSGVRLNYRSLCYSGSILVTILLINVNFLLKANYDRVQYHFKMFAINRIAKLEYYLILVISLCMYAYPSEVMFGLNNPNESHKKLCRLCGILLFSTSVESFSMPSFLFEKDKRIYLLSRLIGNMLELIVIVAGYLVFKAYLEYAFYILVIKNLVHTIVVVIGYIICLHKLRKLKQLAERSIDDRSFTETRIEQSRIDIQIKKKSN